MSFLFPRLTGAAIETSQSAPEEIVSSYNSSADTSSDEDESSSEHDERDYVEGQKTKRITVWQTLGNIEEDIRSLFQVSLMIARPGFGRRYVHSTKQDDWDSRLAHYVDFDLRHVMEKILDWRQSRLHEDVEPIATPELLQQRDTPGDVPGPHGDLVRRLARANTKRRGQFLYWSKHPDQAPTVEDIEGPTKAIPTEVSEKTKDIEHTVQVKGPILTRTPVQGTDSYASASIMSKHTFSTVVVTDVFGPRTTAGPARTVYPESITGVMYSATSDLNAGAQDETISDQGGDDKDSSGAAGGRQSSRGSDFALSDALNIARSARSSSEDDQPQTSYPRLDIPQTKDLLGLNVLHEPETTASVNVIFIHGFYGTSVTSWSLNKDNPESFWPQHWLALEQGLHSARIMTFGYLTESPDMSIMYGLEAYAMNLIYDMDHHSAMQSDKVGLIVITRYSSTNKFTFKTPIVFVAHSLGGLVAKKAYLLAVLAQRDQAHRRFGTAIKGIMFLSTPHWLSSDNFRRIIEASRRRQSGKEVVSGEYLKHLGAMLEANKQFSLFAPKINISSLYETKRTEIQYRVLPTKRMMVVERNSAVIGSHGETVSALDADHQTMCKYTDSEDPNYITVKYRLQSMINEILAEPESRHSAGFIERLLASPQLIDMSISDIDEDGTSRANRTWQELFVEGLFQWRFFEPIYWIIDDLSYMTRPELFISMLRDIPTSVSPIKVLLVSRWSENLEKAFNDIAGTTPVAFIPTDEHFRQDIKLYIQSSVQKLGLSGTAKQELLDMMVRDDITWTEAANRIKKMEEYEDFSGIPF
ncbi:hypothetical protein N0V90_000556 [Kalmusia sp. IMI 367209]|nr:hypothetical protein N0V90_000556 [Kalmusia sp. IMI 367209]